MAFICLSVLEQKILEQSQLKLVDLLLNMEHRSTKLFRDKSLKFSNETTSHAMITV